MGLGLALGLSLSTGRQGDGGSGLSAAFSTFASADYTPTADGVTETALTFTAKDANDAAVDGASVAFSLLPRFSVSASESGVGVSPSSIPDDGITIAVVTATLEDALGNPLADTETGGEVSCAVSGTGNTVTAQSTITDSLGRLYWNVVSTVAAAKTITITAYGLALSTTPTLTVTGEASAWGFDPATAGFTNIVNRPFSTKASSDSDRGTGSFPDRVGGSEGWDGVEYTSANYTIQDDAAAPISPSGVMRIRYPVGQPNNAGPGVAQTQGFNSSAHGNLTFTRLYTRGAFQLGATYHVGSVTNKYYLHRMTELGGAARGEPFLAFNNNGAGGFIMQVNFQGTPDNGLGFFAATSAPGNALQAGTWYLCETYLEMNSAYGVADGIFRCWIDGVLAIERTNVEYLNSATQQYWANIHVSPTYGGSGVPNPSQFDLFVDQLDVWGAA